MRCWANLGLTLRRVPGPGTLSRITNLEITGPDNYDRWRRLADHQRLGASGFPRCTASNVRLAMRIRSSLIEDQGRISLEFTYYTGTACGISSRYCNPRGNQSTVLTVIITVTGRINTHRVSNQTHRRLITAVQLLDTDFICVERNEDA